MKYALIEHESNLSQTLAIVCFSSFFVTLHNVHKRAHVVQQAGTCSTYHLL